MADFDLDFDIYLRGLVLRFGAAIPHQRNKSNFSYKYGP